MSQQLINHSPDLKQLRDEGYEIALISGHLVIKNVPYVNSQREIKRGSLVSELSLSGNRTITPNTHVVHFTGEHPCDKNGKPLTKIVNGSGKNELAKGLIAQYSFSSKPPEGYNDYYKKMTAYINMISCHAHAIDSKADAKTYTPIVSDDVETVFNYIDTASSRAGIAHINQKLENQKVAIIGLGGTGSYIMDFVAKTPAKEIHMYDADIYFQHNAFRSPGAPTLEELQQQPTKVSYLKNIYSRMRKGIFDHAYNIDHTNIQELRDMDFVFICIDSGESKALIFKKLDEFDIPFVDAGMGLYRVKDSCALAGILRVTASTAKCRNHVQAKVSMSNGGGQNDYNTNVQVADLNAFNAVLAVMKWKKLFGFYHDLENEHNTTYTIDGNMIVNEDKHA